jgi:hypothetical protein
MEGFKLGGQWKLPSLVALRMFHARWSMGKHLVWWLMEGSNAWWPLEKKGETFFSLLFTFPLNKILLEILFIDFKVLLYHGSKSLLYVFPSFSLTYKL